MNSTILLPIISPSPSVLVKVIGKDTKTIEVREKIIRSLRVPVKLFASLTNILNLDENGNYIEYLFITFSSEEDLKRSIETINAILSEESSKKGIKFEIIPYLKYGLHYVAKEWPTIYYEPTSMETTIVPIDRLLHILKALQEMLGIGARPLFLEMGRDDGKWIARKYKDSLIELVNNLQILDLVRTFIRAMMHFGYFFEEEAFSEGNSIIIKVRPRIIEGPDADTIRELMIPLIRYYYGVFHGIFEELGLDSTLEANAFTGRIERLRLKIKEKTKEHEFVIMITPKE